MKNYNKILEAINKGIKFALDDFDDEELQGQISSKVKYQGGINEYLDLMEEAVDLRLPSGTVWCKYNLGVDQNQLLNSEDWYGDYYAWGELEPNKTNKNGKIYFDWSNYKFGENYSKLTKYCNNSDYGLNGFTDNLNLTKLLPNDDVAYQTKKLHNFKFHIPTKEQCEELINYTKNYWVKNYDPIKIVHNPKDDRGIRGLNGRVFEGKNGNQLFIPAAGCRGGSDIDHVSSECDLWASSLDLDLPYDACSLYFNSGDISVNHYSRCNGFSIRPVSNL